MYEDTRRRTDALHIEAANFLAATVGHELNNLTTILHGRLELTRHAVRSNESLTRHVEELERTGREMHACIDRLHFLADNRGLVPEVVDINEALADVTETLRGLAGTARLDLVPATVPVTVTSGRRAVALALQHLVENSVRAGATEIRVVLALEKIGEVVVEVRDDGPGLPLEVAQCLTSGRLMPEYCGIGLLLAKTVTERSGGRLEALPVDRGAALRLRFRYVDPAPRNLATGRSHEGQMPKS